MSQSVETTSQRSGLWKTFVRWFDSSQTKVSTDPADAYRVDWVRVLPFVALHVACVLVVWAGFSWIALAVALALYAVRMFGITAFYHRYLSHRAYRLGRGTQFVFALLGAAAAQRGPLWWAAHHRNHHRVSDGPDDPHSPLRAGFWWSHAGWFLARVHFKTRLELVRDWARVPELRFLDRFDALVPIALAGATYLLGWCLERWAPGLGTNGFQMFVWGFLISTVVLYHATFTINSLSHTFGSRRFETRDASRNNVWLALLTFGEGWHNNHHHYPRSARQGFYWWEIDLSYMTLRALSFIGLVHDLQPVPARVLERRRSH